MQFGLTFEKILLIGVIAVIIIGPERLPRAAESFARLVRRVGEYLRDTRTRVKDEMGADLDDVDWRKLDPRQYDPRRIIRDALFDVAEPVEKPKIEPSPVAEPAKAAPQEFSAANRPPYDLEST